MKYLVLLGDGMADEPVAELDGKTPLEYAKTPNMDKLAARGELGLVETVPDGFHPGSDVANLTVFGYDTSRCYTGRSPLEAASMEVELGDNDVAFRLNLVDLVYNYGKLYMSDFSAGHISTEEAAQIIETLQQELGDENFEFHTGVSYRHLLVWRNGKDQMKFVPPHDIIDQSIEDKLPAGEGADELLDLMNSAQMLLINHPVNLRRREAGQPLANSIWLWGHGRAPQMETYKQKFGLSGAVISAVDLIKGIGVYAGLNIIEVPGATGYLDTNYRGKAEAALETLKNHDFVYVHVEAPDEAGHSGDLQEKIRAIERFDDEVVGTVLQGIDKLGEWRMLVLPDHPTPVALRTHTIDPVPYILCTSEDMQTGNSSDTTYSEKNAQASGVKYDIGYKLLAKLVQKDV
ncbi:MAG: cofactor-independent phosphoglycerate mutase [Desulfobacteraceae bacterium 4572_35.1]|nr:MAG: cofactor-independent phosphoglycerate mutase [Desulfobacteraceae bacterium 4572_35.1]